MTQRIFHIATRSDWEEALRTGIYTTSTAGRTLAEEGFIHASRREQVRDVFDRHYRSLNLSLVLLTVDPARLIEAEVRVENVGADTYPHIYGPLNRSAVVDAVPLSRNGSTETMVSLFVKEMGLRMCAATLVMLIGAIGLVLGGAFGEDDSAYRLVGLLIGMVVGGLLVWRLAQLRGP